jgi:tRNA1Val (adenine37-N6)-methyltransferase
MKVCTDSCLFGAWTAHKISQDIPCGKEYITAKKILDIGTGTGLLALMIAQKSRAEIHGVEIEKNAFEQTKENFEASPWAGRLKAFHSDVKVFNSADKYDLIISNPPFFENDLKSNVHHKNLAKHHDGLLLKDLLFSIENHLSEQGNFALLLPFHRDEEMGLLAKNAGFFLAEKLLVKQTPKHDYFRVMHFYTKEKEEVKTNEIIIKNENNIYSEKFHFLLRDYYLNFS